MTKEAFKKGMLILRETFPERFSEMDRTSMQVWYQLLHDIPDRDWERAVLFISRNNEKPPVPAIIRKVANENYSMVSAEEAWLQVTQAVRTYGYVNHPKFEDRVLQKTVEAIGWRHICQVPTEAIASLRAHFYRTYEAVKLSEQRNAELLAIEQSKVVKYLETSGQSPPEQHSDQE